MPAEIDENPLNQYLSQLRENIRIYRERSGDTEVLQHYKAEYRALVLALGELRANDVLNFFEMPEEPMGAALLGPTQYEKALGADEALKSKRPASLRAA